MTLREEERRTLLFVGREGARRSTATTGHYYIRRFTGILSVSCISFSILSLAYHINPFAGSATTDVVHQPLPVVEPVVRPLSKRAQQQVVNYRAGTGLMLNLHITHHAGTAFCDAVGRSPDANGRTPTFACWTVTEKDDKVGPDYPYHNPWRGAEETATNIRIARRDFHMISWEYEKAPVVPLADTNWEDPNLFSVLVVRDPMKRMLAGDAILSRDFPGVMEGTADSNTLHRWAHSDLTDNYALRILAGDGCCDGKNTDRGHLEAAKALVKRFSVVIDIECLTESLQALAANEWGISVGRMHPSKVRASPRERIGDQKVFDFLQEKNKLDIELYEWAKGLSYLDCSTVQRRFGT